MSDISAKPLPHRVKLTSGRKYRWCSCGLSQKQPFCDDAHRRSDKIPVLFSSEEDLIVALCGCKLTTHGPYCDGAHAHKEKG